MVIFIVAIGDDYVLCNHIINNVTSLNTHPRLHTIPYNYIRSIRECPPFRDLPLFHQTALSVRSIRVEMWLFHRSVRKTDPAVFLIVHRG
jgi:hypothetical protein